MMKQELSFTRKPLFLCLMIGVFQGVVISMLMRAQYNGMIAYYFLAISGWMFICAFNNKNNVRLVVSTLLVSLLAAMVATWQNTPSVDAPLCLFFMLLVATFGMNIFHQVYHRANSFKVSYAPFFFIFWDNISAIIVAIVWVCLVWTLLVLWAALFDILNIRFFSTVFYSNSFVGFISPVLFALGLYLAAHLSNIVRQVRHIILLLFKYSLPLLAFITLIFLATWLVLSLSTMTFSSLGFYMSIQIVLFGVLFVNGIYQQGGGERPYPPFIQYLVNVFILTLPFISAIAIHSKWHSLNAGNFNELLLAGFMLIYTACYAVLLLRRQQVWLASLGKVNIVLGLIYIIVMMLLNNPVFTGLSINPGNVRANDNAGVVTAPAAKRPSMAEHLKKAGISWQKETKHSIVLGYAQGKPLHACLVVQAQQTFIGEAKGGRCQYAISHSIKDTADYKVLSGKDTMLRWQRSGGYQTGFMYIPMTVGKQSLSICRAIVANRIHIGFQRLFKCSLIVNSKVVSIDNYSILFVKR